MWCRMWVSIGGFGWVGEVEAESSGGRGEGVKG